MNRWGVGCNYYTPDAAVLCESLEEGEKSLGLARFLWPTVPRQSRYRLQFYIFCVR